jgi:hypothetical protein
MLTDSDGSPREANGPVTVSAVRTNGETLFEDRDASAGAELGEYVTELTSVDTDRLDMFLLTWTEADGGVYTSTAEVVGGFYFSPDEARNAAPGLTNSELYPMALLIDARNEVEQECERITGRAFVPRYKRITLDARQGLRLPDIDIRAVRRLMVGGIQSPVAVGQWGELYPLLAEQVANAGEDYQSIGTIGNGEMSPEVVVEYEYGLEAPPADLKRAVLIRFVDRLGIAKTGAPSRNEYQVIDGQIFTVTQPGVRGSLTGIREVDAVYAAYSVRRDVQAVRIGAR